MGMFWKRDQHVKRPGDGKELGALEELEKGCCGWSRMERGSKEGQETCRSCKDFAWKSSAQVFKSFM